MVFKKKSKAKSLAARHAFRLTTELKEKGEELTKALRKTIEQVANTGHLQKEIETLQEENTSLKEELKDAQNLLTEVTSWLQRAQDRNLTTSKDLRYACTVVKRCKASNISLKEQQKGLEMQIWQREPELTDSMRQIDSLHFELSSHSASLQSFAMALSEQRIKCNGEEQHAESLKKDLKKLKKKDQCNTNEFEKHAKHLQERLDKLKQKLKACRMRLLRAKKRVHQLIIIKKNSRNAMKLTSKGSYNTRVRSLVRWMCSLGCPLTKCGKVFAELVTFTCESLQFDSSMKSLGINIPSIRSIRRMICEAGIASKVQLAEEMRKTVGFTTGGDGTMNKSQNIESFHLNYQLPVESEGDDGLHTVQHVRFGNARLAANHQAQTHVKGNVNFMNNIIDIWKRSPLAVEKDSISPPLDIETAALKYHGSHGDHAEDQKAKHWLFAAWKEETSMQGLGARHFFSMSKSECEEFTSQGRREMVLEVGGESAWNELTAEEQNKKKLVLTKRLANELANEALQSLPEDERRHIVMFVWVGCGMHKDLNSVKGGDSAMQEEWKKHRISPCLLANKDNAAVLDLADDDLEESPAEKCAPEVSKAGGVKLMDLIGSLFNDKDDKKGWHHIFRDWCIVHLCRMFTFPDTSNTRYSSYLDAAAETLTHLSEFLKFMESIRYSKERPGLNHLEENVRLGLNDAPTLTELACMALYREAVSIPYITSIQGTSLEEVNVLELGPRLQKVRSHIRTLLAQPERILSTQSKPEEAILDRNKSWNRPDMIEAIHKLITTGRLPKLNELSKALLNSTLSTWERFLSEFNEDGSIAALTKEEKEAAWMPATNDANEGALGAFRVFHRHKPNGTIELFNSLFRYHRNGTEEFISKELTGEKYEKFLKEEARLEDVAGIDRKRRREINAERDEACIAKRQKCELRQQKKSGKEERIEAVKLEVDQKIIDDMNVKEIKDQLAKYRKIYPCIGPL
ncbi:hypothetical protein ACEPAI_3348 [Sanghuangporus weigelae]